MLMVTASGPVTEAPEIWSANAGPVRTEVDCFSMLRCNALASSGVPSWKTIPGRRLMVKAVKSALEVIDSARYGSTPPEALTMAMGSMTERPYRNPPSSQRAVEGSKPLSSVSMPKVSEPPLTGLAVEIPFSPGPLVWFAPASPSSPPRIAAPAPSASPPAMNDRRSKDCVIANPHCLDPHCYGSVARQVTTS